MNARRVDSLKLQLRAAVQLRDDHGAGRSVAQATVESLVAKLHGEIPAGELAQLAKLSKQGLYDALRRAQNGGTER